MAQQAYVSIEEEDKEDMSPINNQYKKQSSLKQKKSDQLSPYANNGLHEISFSKASSKDVSGSILTTALRESSPLYKVINGQILEQTKPSRVSQQHLTIPSSRPGTSFSNNRRFGENLK